MLVPLSTATSAGGSTGTILGRTTTFGKTDRVRSQICNVRHFLVLAFALFPVMGDEAHLCDFMSQFR